MTPGGGKDSPTRQFARTSLIFTRPMPTRHAIPEGAPDLMQCMFRRTILTKACKRRCPQEQVAREERHISPGSAASLEASAAPSNAGVAVLPRSAPIDASLRRSTTRCTNARASPEGKGASPGKRQQDLPLSERMALLLQPRKRIGRSSFQLALQLLLHSIDAARREIF